MIFFSRALGTLKFDTCHKSCCIIGIACSGSTSGLKYPFSVKSNAMPASLLNRTSRRTILSSLVRLCLILSFSILLGVNRRSLTILENLGIHYGYWEPLLLLSSPLYIAICSFQFSTPSGLSPSLCCLFTGFTLCIFLLYKVFISPYEFNDRLLSLVTDTYVSVQLPFEVSVSLSLSTDMYVSVATSWTFNTKASPQSTVCLSKHPSLLKTLSVAPGIATNFPLFQPVDTYASLCVYFFHD